MTKTFFTKSVAERFAETLRQQGFENVEIWTGRDGFGQEIYTVKWETDTERR